MWMKIKIKLRWLHLLSKLKAVYRRFLAGVRRNHMRPTGVTQGTLTRLNTTHSAPSLLRGIQASDPRRVDLSLSHSSTPHSDQMITIMEAGTAAKSGGDFCQGAHSDRRSVNIQASSERLEMMDSGRIVEENSGMTPAEAREQEAVYSHKNKIKRKIIEGALSISILGIKITSMLILPFCSIFTSCTENE